LGERVDMAALETTPKAGFLQRFRREVDLVVCIGGIYVMFILYAYLQEKVYVV
jgi:hypothetical protein